MIDRHDGNGFIFYLYTNVIVFPLNKCCSVLFRRVTGFGSSENCKVIFRLLREVAQC